MARQDAKMETRYQHITPPRRKLEYLLNETYVKIDELKELLRKVSCCELHAKFIKWPSIPVSF